MLKGGTVAVEGGGSVRTQVVGAWCGAVQAHASAAVVNFSENCEQELLPPYLDTLISKLLILLQRGQRTVQVLESPPLPQFGCRCKRESRRHAWIGFVSSGKAFARLLHTKYTRGLMDAWVKRWRSCTRKFTALLRG